MLSFKNDAMINEKGAEKIFEQLREDDIKFLVGHGLSKLLTWFVVFLTVFVSFLQLLNGLNPCAEKIFTGVLWCVVKNPLWLVEYFLLICIVFVIKKLLITYKNQLEWEYRLPRNLNKLIWRRHDKIIGVLLANQNIASLSVFLILNWVFFY